MFEEELIFNHCKIHPEILPLQPTQESGPHRIHTTAVSGPTRRAKNIFEVSLVEHTKLFIFAVISYLHLGLCSQKIFF